MNSVPANKRLHTFDLLRLSLVLIALLNHFLITHGGRPETPGQESTFQVVQEVKREEAFAINEFEKTENINLKAASAEMPDFKKEAFNYVLAITRSAMPVLLIIFGFMIEYVYARRWKIQGSKIIFERMMNRAVVCYLAFAAIVLLVYFQGFHTTTTFLGSMVFAFDGHSHANLFKYYALLIPMTFLLMAVRFKFGWVWKLILVCLSIGLAEWLKVMYPGFPGVFDHVSKFFLGLGDRLGPSMIHSLVLILFGALVANYQLNRKFSLPAIVLVLLSVFSFGALAVEIYTLGFNEFVVSIADYYTYRAKNSYVYFAYGIVTFILFWGLSWIVMLKMSHYIKEKISYYGGNTFIIFFYGNVIILLLPVLMDNQLFKLVIAGITLILSLAAVNAFDYLNNNFKFLTYINKQIALVVNKGIFVLYAWPADLNKRKVSISREMSSYPEREPGRNISEPELPAETKIKSGLIQDEK